MCAAWWSSVCNFESKLSRCHSGCRQMGDLMLKPESYLLIYFSLPLSDPSLFSYLHFYPCISLDFRSRGFCIDSFVWILWGFPKPKIPKAVVLCYNTFPKQKAIHKTVYLNEAVWDWLQSRWSMCIKNTICSTIEASCMHAIIADWDSRLLNLGLNPDSLSQSVSLFLSVFLPASLSFSPSLNLLPLVYTNYKSFPSIIVYQWISFFYSVGCLTIYNVEAVLANYLKTFSSLFLLCFIFCAPHPFLYWSNIVSPAAYAFLSLCHFVLCFLFLSL